MNVIKIKFRPEILFLILAALLNAISWLWVERGVPPSAFPVIVHYNIFWGQDFLGERPLIFSSSLLGMLILAINTILIKTLREDRYAFLRLELGVATLILESFVLAAAWFVVAANT
jgi:hypothetical protein